MQKREDNGCKAISSGSAQAEGLSMDGVYEHLVLCFIRPKTFTQGAVQTPAASYSYLEQLQQAKTPGPDYLLQGDRAGPATCSMSWKLENFAPTYFNCRKKAKESIFEKKCQMNLAQQDLGILSIITNLIQPSNESPKFPKIY